MEQRRDIFQAIADPTRRQILSLLSTKPKNVNAIAENFNMTRQAISLHIKILQECNVIKVNKNGRERNCAIIPDKLSEIDNWIKPFRELWEKRFNQLDDVLKTIK